jgi:hypothetical protein
MLLLVATALPGIGQEKAKPPRDRAKIQRSAGSKRGDKLKIQRVTFPKRGATAIMKGMVDSRVAYTLHASSGQTIKLHLAAQKGVGLENVTGPTGSPIKIQEKPEFGATRDWLATLPASGDYRITLNKFMETDRPLAYTLEITVR